MKISLNLIVLLILTSSLYSQQKFTPGNYILTADFFSISGGKAFRIENNQIKSLYFDSSLKLHEVSNIEDLIVKETASILNNNATVTTITTFPNKQKTETTTKNIFYIGNPFVYRTNYSNTINYLSEASCFEKGNSCSTRSFVGYARPWPTLFRSKEYISTGGKSSEYIHIEEIRLTDTTTEITISINSKGGTIHPPGSEKAYYLSLSDGTKIKLLGQFGWKGNQKGNYGSWTSTYNTKKKCVLFFEKISLTNLLDGINLKEGKCKDNCWNFYDVKI